MKRGPKPNSAKHRKAAQLRRDGLTWKQIGKQLHVTPHGARRLAEASGEDMTPRYLL